MFITVREINELRDSKPLFPLAFAFHFKKFAKIHFFLYSQHVGDIFFPTRFQQRFTPPITNH